MEGAAEEAKRVAIRLQEAEQACQRAEQRRAAAEDCIERPLWLACALDTYEPRRHFEVLRQLVQPLQDADHLRRQGRIEAQQMEIPMLRQRTKVKGRVREDMLQTVLPGAFHYREIVTRAWRRTPRTLRSWLPQTAPACCVRSKKAPYYPGKTFSAL